MYLHTERTLMPTTKEILNAKLKARQDLDREIALLETSRAKEAKSHVEENLHLLPKGVQDDLRFLFRYIQLPKPITERSGQA